MTKRRTKLELQEEAFEARQIANGYVKCDVCRNANWIVWHSPSTPCPQSNNPDGEQK